MFDQKANTLDISSSHVVVVCKTFQDFVFFCYKLCLFGRQLNYLHIDTNHYIVS